MPAGRKVKSRTARRLVRPVTEEAIAAAWSAVHENTPDGWYVGQPMEHPERNEWSMYAFDPSETPVVGKRSREWIAVGQTELRCVPDDGVRPG